MKAKKQSVNYNENEGFWEMKYIPSKVWRTYDEWIEENDVERFLDWHLTWAREEPGRYIGVSFNARNELRFTLHSNDWYERFGDKDIPVLIIAEYNHKKYHVVIDNTRHLLSKKELIAVLSRMMYTL